MDNAKPLSFVFYLVPGFSLVALSCAIDALRAANVELGREQFSWHVSGSDPDNDQATKVTSSSGLSMDIVPTSQLPDCDIIAVCGGERSHLFYCPRSEVWLRQQARSGKIVGSISDAAYVLAGIGLFDNCRSTIHWKCQLAYRERYPNLDVRPTMLEIDGNRFSCAGGTASLDLMLKFIVASAGEQVAGKIADNYFHDVIRGDGDDQVQHMTSVFRFAGREKLLSDALELMETHLEEPLPIAEIASRLDTTPRQLDRLFGRHLAASPSAFYRDLRLTRASGLLKQSMLSVSEIAVGCGFHSASHLSRYFKKKYGETPLRHRRAS